MNPDQLAHRAFVDSPFRCRWCGKRMVEEVRNNAEGVPNLVTTCLNCDPWTTRGTE